jgi:hypothetical protein
MYPEVGPGLSGSTNATIGRQRSAGRSMLGHGRLRRSSAATRRRMSSSWWEDEVVTRRIGRQVEATDNEAHSKAIQKQIETIVGAKEKIEAAMRALPLPNLPGGDHLP